MAAITLTLFGGFELRSAEGTAIPLGLKKAKALLAYLALCPGQPQARDKLAALLWESSAEAQARLSLRQALNNLRKALVGADNVLVADTDTVTLSAVAFDVDVSAFERLLAEATPAALKQAVSLYQGEFLEGLNPRSTAFEDWLMAHRSHLRERALTAMSVLLEHYLAVARYEPAVRLAIRLLALDPLRESAHRTLMTLYAKQGRHSAALKQYRLCREVLQRELKIAPEAETEQLHQQLYRQRRDADEQSGVDDTQSLLQAAAVDSIINTASERSVQPSPLSAEQNAFIGRRNERHQFTTAVEACIEVGYGQSFLLRGEAGIGKTRLVQEVMAIAGLRGFACYQALVLDFGSATDAIRSLILSLLDLESDDDPEQVQVATEHLLGDMVITSDHQVFLNDLLNLPQPRALQSILDAMDDSARRHGRQTLLAWLIDILSHRQPLLLVLEDIHWADSTTLGYLATITATVVNCPTLLVMTSRVEGEPLDPNWRGAMQGAPLTTIDLGPLREDEAWTLAQQWAGIDIDFARRCVKRAAGNPLFLEQLLRAGEDSESIPDSIQSIIQMRLNHLKPNDKTAIQAASVLGQYFSLEVLRWLLDDPHYSGKTLLGQRLIRPEGDDYLFAHALIMEGIYESIPVPQRRRLHRRAAKWFAERNKTLYAEHLERAEDPRAPLAYLDAAQAQARRYRHSRALDLVQRGLQIVRDPTQEYALSCFHGELLQQSGAIDASLDEFQHALHLATDEHERCRPWIGKAAGLSTQDRHSEALAALAEAEQVAGQAQIEERAQIQYRRGNSLFLLGRINECMQAHERALHLARETTSPELNARIFSGLADAYFQRGQILTAYAYFDRCLVLCREHGLGQVEVANLSMHGFTRFYNNELKAALEDLHQAADMSVKVGNQRAEMLARNSLGNLLAYAGDWGTAKEQSEQSLALARRLGATLFEAANLYHVGHASAVLGSPAEGEKRVEQAYRLLLDSESGIAFTGSWALGVWAHITTDPDRRNWALREGEAQLQTRSLSTNYLHFYQLAMEVSLSAQDWSGVERYAALLEDYTRVEPLPWSDFFIARGRALADRGQGVDDQTTRASLLQLRDEAQRVGLITALAAMSD